MGQIPTLGGQIADQLRGPVEEVDRRRQILGSSDRLVERAAELGKSRSLLRPGGSAEQAEDKADGGEEARAQRIDRGRSPVVPTMIPAPSRATTRRSRPSGCSWRS